MHEINQIDALAELCGIPSQYVDASGKPVAIKTDYKLSALRALGIDASSTLEVQSSIDRILRQQWSSMLPVVHVVHIGQPILLPVQVNESSRNDQIQGEIDLENSQVIPIEIDLAIAQEVDRLFMDQKEKIRLHCSLPDDLPPGYHSLTLAHGSHQEQCHLIVAPKICHEPDIFNIERPGFTEKIWGVSVQLYTLRSENNWGIGDFSDLKHLVIALGQQGADIVGLNPIHSLYPENPLHCSPYSPSSRNFINPLYIDVTALEEFRDSPEIQQIVADADFYHRLEKTKSSDYVEYHNVAALKLPILEMAFAHFEKCDKAHQTSRSAHFGHFCEQKGKDLELQATYEALFEYFRAQDITNLGWDCWPDDYQDPNNRAITNFAKNAKERIRYY
ncbi:MAG: 4-alpha-glucanotransferase, partial [Endozoicomonas sp.]